MSVSVYTFSFIQRFLEESMVAYKNIMIIYELSFSVCFGHPFEDFHFFILSLHSKHISSLFFRELNMLPSLILYLLSLEKERKRVAFFFFPSKD